MFWRRSNAVPREETAPPVHEAIDTSKSDAAIETLGAMLRWLGEHNFDLPDANAAELTKTFERWTRHILLAGPHPARDPDDDGEEDSAPPARDFPGLRQFFRAHRKKEAEHVVRSLSELRALIWTFVDRLARNLPDEARFELGTRGQIEKLRRAVATNSIDDIKREALSTVSYLERAIEERNEKRRMEIEELSSRIQALSEELEDAREESETDALTQIANRRAFDRQLERAVTMSILCAQKNVLILIDADHFKRVNDVYGHPAGDAVLRAIAKQLVKCFPRKVDCVARFGGEEFAVLLRDTGVTDGKRLAERFLTALRELTVEHDGKLIRVTASAGIAELAREERVDGWIARGDAALYRAKTEGRNRAIAA